MGDMTVDELKSKKLWFLWSAKPGRNGKVTKVPFAANGGATGTDDAHKGTWVSFDDAESARNQFQASGLGLKISKGFFLLDIAIRIFQIHLHSLCYLGFLPMQKYLQVAKGFILLVSVILQNFRYILMTEGRALCWTVNIIRNALILDWNFISVILQIDMALLQETRLTV